MIPEKVTKKIRIILFLAFLAIFPHLVYSQKKSDIGIFAGTSTYNGDLNPVKPFYLPGYAIGPFFRYNFEPRNSIRLSGIYHSLSGSSANYGDPFVESLNRQFDATFIDIAANYEINFLPYKTTIKKMNHSFYLSGGLGYNILLTSGIPDAKSHFTIPFGLGYKVNVGKKMGVGAEITVKKTFSDDSIDGTINFGSESTKALFGNKDWYTFAGIFISYKIFNYREDCPAYEQKR